MAQALELETGAARISEYESGTRVPHMIVVMRYARLAGVAMETLVDDKLKLKASSLYPAQISQFESGKP